MQVVGNILLTTEANITLFSTFKIIFLFINGFTYNIEIDKVTKVLGSTEQRTVVACELLPGAMEVIGHHINKVEFPEKNTERSLRQWPENPGFLPEYQLMTDTHLAISAISYPASMVPFPAATAAVNMS